MKENKLGTKSFGGYYEFLKEEVNKFKGDFDPFIFHAPEFFKLLTNLLNSDRIDKEDRMKINCALAYFVAPDDVLPEEIYGPFGYIDDIFLCCKVLNDLKDKHGVDLLESLWEHDEDFRSVLDYSYRKSRKIIEDKEIKSEILNYSGLA